MIDNSSTAFPTSAHAPKLDSVNSPYALNRIWQGLRIALDVLVAILLVIALVRNPSWPTVIWALGFSAVYIAGSIGPIGKARQSHDHAQIALTNPNAGVLAWLGLLLGMWAGLAFTALDAAYLAFPLFFIVLHIASGWLATLLVVLTTLCAIFAIAVQSSWTFGGVLGPLLGGAVALTVGLGFRMLQREAVARALALEELSAARAESEALSRRAGELDERARLAADIHDTVAQGLSSIQLLLHSAEAKIAEGHASDALSTLQLARTVASDNLTETRRIIAALQPAVLDGANLDSALRKVCSSTPLGDAVSFSVDGMPAALPSNVETTLVRIAQSTLANVVKHAQATRCGVTLTYQPDEVLLDIVDNGVGFDPAKPVSEGSIGIASARRRVASIGGELTIESAPGQGCGVSVRIPRTEAAHTENEVAQ